jgi:hypothetical protein
MQTNEVVQKAKEVIPPVNEILDKAISNLGIANLQPNDILTNFADLTKKLESEAFKVYQEYEDVAFKTLTRLCRGEKALLNEKETELLVQATRELEFKAGQMRKARGGASFQKIIQRLLNLAGIRCEEPHTETKRLLRRIDLVSPSAEVAKNTPDKAIFLAVKRTLRERWKQAVPEQMKGARLYLVTMNGECPEGKAKEIKEAGMVAYVPNELKEQSHLRHKSWIRPLSSLPQDIKDAIPKT